MTTSTPTPKKKIARTANYGQTSNYSTVYQPQENVLEAAQRRMREIFDNCDTPVVSSSGGKDSTVILELALREAQRRGRLPLNVVVIDDEVIDPDTVALIDKLATRPGIKLWRVCLPIKHTLRSEVRTHWFTWDEDYRDLWVRELPKDAITLQSSQVLEFPEWAVKGRLMLKDVLPLLMPEDRYGHVYGIIGVRAEESLVRRRAILKTGGYVTNPESIYPHYQKAKPIYDWSARDVWKAIGMFGWEYSHYYERCRMAGISAHRQRVGPWGNVAASKEADLYAQFYPDYWEKVIKRLPELEDMARYGKSKLYRRLMDKPTHLTWQEYCLSLIEKFEDADTQEFWTKIVAQRLKTWSMKSTAPFPEVIDQKAYGTYSWKKLAAMVAKNDRFRNDNA